MKRWGVLLLVLIALCLASETALAYAAPDAAKTPAAE